MLAQKRPGSEYSPPQPSSRPVPSPAQHVGQQLDDLIGEIQGNSVVPNSNANEVVFSRTYRAHDLDVLRVTFRRPKTRDIKTCGTPLRVITGPDGRIQDIEMKWDVIAKYIPLLSEPPLPPSTVDELDYFDLDSCAAVIASFFVKLEMSGI